MNISSPHGIASLTACFGLGDPNEIENDVWILDQAGWRKHLHKRVDQRPVLDVEPKIECQPDWFLGLLASTASGHAAALPTSPMNSPSSL